MKPPIIVYEWGDVGIYPTVEVAENNLEPIDVQNGEYFVFDSEGRLLEVWVGPIDGGIHISAFDDKPRFSAQLRKLLTEFLLRSVGRNRGWFGRAKFSRRLRDAQLHELVNMALEYQAQ